MMNPKFAMNIWLLALVNVLVTLSCCGPGYTYSIIGYFFAGSKSNGLYITPYRAGMPSSAFTWNGSGNLYPACMAVLRSTVSSGMTFVPAASNNTFFGAVFTLDEVSMK